MKDKPKKTKITFSVVIYFMIALIIVLAIVELSFTSKEGFIENTKFKYVTEMDEKTQIVNDGSGKLLVITDEKLDPDNERLLREKVKEQYGTDDFILQPSWEVMYKNAQKQSNVPLPAGYNDGY